MIPPIVRSVVIFGLSVANLAADVPIVMTKSPGLQPTGSSATSNLPEAFSTTRNDLEANQKLRFVVTRSRTTRCISIYIISFFRFSIHLPNNR